MNTKLNHVQNWEELAQAANWSVEKMAILCKVSTRTLDRYFLKIKGQSPHVWLAELRQVRALKLLRNGASVKEAAADLGYKHPGNFSRKFKRHWGDCPVKASLAQALSGNDTK